MYLVACLGTGLVSWHVSTLWLPRWPSRKASASRVADLDSIPAFGWDLFPGPVATLPGAWHYKVSTGTGWPGVSILWLGWIASLICNFCLSVAACTIVYADASLRYTSMLLGHYAASNSNCTVTGRCVWNCCRRPKLATHYHQLNTTNPSPYSAGCLGQFEPSCRTHDSGFEPRLSQCIFRLGSLFLLCDRHSCVLDTQTPALLFPMVMWLCLTVCRPFSGQSHSATPEIPGYSWFTKINNSWWTARWTDDYIS